MNRKIIGYKCPFDTFKIGEVTIVKEGDIYVKDYISDRYKGYLVREDIFRGRSKAFNVNITYLPSEIVELWEPIYEEIIFDSFDDIIRHFKGDLVMINNNIVVTPKEVQKLVLDIIINKQNYRFTHNFELRLKELGISI